MRPGLLFIAAALAVAPAGSPRAAPTVECHCFRDRSFDAATPAAADPYILASARSSLLSAAFGVPKAALVRAVMTGTAPEDLWIAHWSGARTGRTAAWLLDAVAETGSWRAALAGASGVPAPFAAALARGAAGAELAALAVDDVLAARLGADAASLRALRAAGAGSEQVIVATLPVAAPRDALGGAPRPLHRRQRDVGDAPARRGARARAARGRDQEERALSFVGSRSARIAERVEGALELALLLLREALPDALLPPELLEVELRELRVAGRAARRVAARDGAHLAGEPHVIGAAPAPRQAVQAAPGARAAPP